MFHGCYNYNKLKIAWTASGDGTSNKHIGYHCQHANIQKLPGYKSCKN